METDTVRYDAFNLALDLAKLRGGSIPTVESLIADARKIEEYLAGGDLPVDEEKEGAA